MEFTFRGNNAYLISKNVFRLSLVHTQKDEFKKNETLKRRVEKSSLCITSLIVKAILAKSEKEKAEIIKDLMHLIYSLCALYDIALDLGLIGKKDLYLIETALKELIEEIKKL
ncbi:MAG: hypothetical protein WA063_02795 [Minisyncoccia bacterium]